LVLSKSESRRRTDWNEGRFNLSFVIVEMSAWLVSNDILPHRNIGFSGERRWLSACLLLGYYLVAFVMVLDVYVHADDLWIGTHKPYKIFLV